MMITDFAPARRFFVPGGGKKVCGKNRGEPGGGQIEERRSESLIILISTSRSRERTPWGKKKRLLYIRD